MKKLITLLTMIVFMAAFATAKAAAADFGLIIDQGASVGGEKEISAVYDAVFIPRFSFLLGDSTEFMINAGMTVGTGDTFYYIPELLRTELTLRFGDAKITAGRMYYLAPFARLADGLFDGLQFAYNSGAGMFNIGAWYTGFLYKKNANILISAEDRDAYYSAVDYDNFTDTYFASRRVMAALGWEHPALGELLRAKFAIIAQTDLNDNDNGDYMHSQYVTGKIGIPLNNFMAELSGAFELAWTGDMNMGFAGELGLFWALSVAGSDLLPGQLAFTAYYSGSRNESASTIAFVPVTNRFYGDVLEASSSGISALSLDYTARLHRTFSLGVTSSYVIRNDLETYMYYPVDIENNTGGYFLGNEFFARLVWSPVSDLQVNLGGGIFLPSMGNAAPDREVRWCIKLAAIFALF